VFPDRSAAALSRQGASRMIRLINRMRIAPPKATAGSPEALRRAAPGLRQFDLAENARLSKKAQKASG